MFPRSCSTTAHVRISWRRLALGHSRRTLSVYNPSRPSRSYLYVPSSSTRMLEKSRSTLSDTVIYDLEDSVAPAQKEAARLALTLFLQETFLRSHSRRVAVRVNAPGTNYFDQDIAETLKCSVVGTLVVPKVHSVDDLTLVSESILKHSSRSDVQIIASIESARAMWAVGQIAAWKPKFAQACTLKALLFAAEDYCADTSIIRTPQRGELLFARSRMVTAAKAYGLQAIDMVCVNYKDPAYLQEECEDGRRLGFDGKQAIHPNQLDTIHSTFLPSSGEILRAARIVHHMKNAYHESKGAFGLQSHGIVEMIDAPMLKQAQITLATAQAASLVIPEIHD